MDSPSPQDLARARAEHPARELASLLQRLETLRRAAEQRHGILTTAERRLLWLLSDQAPRTLREISTQLNLEQSTVNRQVNGAAKAGLVRIVEAHPARHVEVTEAGIEAFNADVVEILDGYQGALGRMGQERAERFTDSLSAFVSTYGQVLSAEG